MNRLRFPALSLVIAAAALRPLAAEPAAPTATSPSATIALFNGRDLQGWYSFLEKSGRDSDPNGNFKVQDGVIRIEGRDFGYIATTQSFENYRLKVEFKWGVHQYAPRATGKRDSGVLYHFGTDAPDKVWPTSIECQVQEGDCGDIWCVGTDVTSINRQAHEWGMKRVFRTEDFEHPTGEWNTIEVVANGDTIEHYVNGHLVNRATHTSVRRGKILLQSEGAEVYYRKVELTPLPAAR